MSSVHIRDFHVEENLAQLTQKEKLYATYMHLAGQSTFPLLASAISNESLSIHKFLSEFIPSIPVSVIRKEFSDLNSPLHSVFEQFFLYSAYFYHENGNYSGFGNKKFIPQIQPEDLKSLVSSFNPSVQPLLDACISDMYNLDPTISQIDWYPNGCSPLYSPLDFSHEEEIAIDDILQSNKIRKENTRLVRTTDSYEVQVFSIAKSKNQIGFYNSKPVFLVKGLFSEVLKRSVHFLTLAKQYAASEVQISMIDKLIQFYETGEMNDFLEYNKEWIKDNHPSVETILGPVETYHDPAGIRSEFESLIAVVDKAGSSKFQSFIEAAPQILSLLPLSPFYQRKCFSSSYNSLNVLSYMTNGQFVGINLPNFYEISTVYGFKNMTLSNTINHGTNQKTSINKEVQNIHIMCHEFYGHGSGRLLSKSEDKTGQKSILTGKNLPQDCGYDETKNETFDILFGDLSSSFEECRAESTGLFLVLNEQILDIFNVPKENQKSYMETEINTMANNGLFSIKHWDPIQKKWSSAHSQGRFTILKAMLNWGKEALVKNGGCYSLVEREGAIDDIREAVRKLLIYLNEYKSTGMWKEGREFLTSMSVVDGEFLEYVKNPENVDGGKSVKTASDGKYPTCSLFFEAYVEKVGNEYLLTGGTIPDHEKMHPYELTMRAIKNLKLALED